MNPQAISALRHNQRQLDIDGAEVGVSRQALEELLDWYENHSARRDCLPPNHTVIEQADMHDGTARVSQTVIIGPESDGVCYERIVHMDEAFLSEKGLPPVPPNFLGKDLLDLQNTIQLIAYTIVDDDGRFRAVPRSHPRALDVDISSLPEYPEKRINVEYRNWRGEVRNRELFTLTLWYGSTEYHPDIQWFLTAVAEDGKVKDFALKDFSPHVDVNMTTKPTLEQVVAFVANYRKGTPNVLDMSYEDRIAVKKEAIDNYEGFCTVLMEQGL